MPRLFLVEMYRSLMLQARYPIDTLGGLVLLVFLFYGLLIGARFITGADAFNENLSGVIVGYATWMMLYSGMMHVPTTIQGEAQRGTLEILFLSYLSVHTILLTRALVQSLISIALTVVILSVLLWMTGRQVAIRPEVALPVATTVIAAIGVGFVGGGMALRFKQIGQVMLLAQYPLLFLMLTPFEEMDAFIATVALALPVVPSAATLRELMISQLPLLDTHYLAAVVNSAVYLGIGMVVFRCSARRVKQIGVLAGY